MSEIASPQPVEQLSPEFQRLKVGMRATWMAGDFGVIARTIAGSGGDAFVQRLALQPGLHVLDVATGTGNVALPLARSGCIVTGLDLAPNLLVQARERAAAEDLSITFDEGDAEALPYADASFDAVVTMFGAMFAPRPDRIAAELARVLKPGGLLAMANWNAAGFSGRMFRANAKHVPPPPGVPPPVLWGDESTVRERLGSTFTDMKTEIIPMDFDLAMSPTETVSFFRTFFGPTKMAFDHLDDAGKAALETDLIALWTTSNASDDAANHTLVHNQYLQVTARRA